MDLKVDVPPPTNTFKKLLDDIVLCTSLNVKPPLPFLETEVGKKCELRKFFPQEIYWSKYFEKEHSVEVLHPIDTQTDLEDENVYLKNLINSRNVDIVPRHPFLDFKMTGVIESSTEIQSLLADFRARGGTLRYLCSHEQMLNERKGTNNAPAPVAKEATKPEIASLTGLCWEKKMDVLDPYNHQSLAVLFSSYSNTSDNAPNYCVNPWVVTMEFYGSNDITLGGFLERYCFRSSYICPSSSCITPMTEHVRKFVHGTGCVHILLHELNSGAPVSENNILMWSYCYICNSTATPVVSMSQDTWSFSFAKYLELRFYSNQYTQRGNNKSCNHSLHHDHYQYFAQNNLVAIFKYTPVLIWEIVFPSSVITICDKFVSIRSVVDQIKMIAMKGHGVHSDLLTALFALRDEFTETTSEDFVEDMIDMLKLETLPFREQIENVQLLLTSSPLESLHKNFDDSVEQSKDIGYHLWKIEDKITLLKFHIAGVVNVWNNRIQEFVSARKKEQKTKVSSQSSRVSEDDTASKWNTSSIQPTPPSDLTDTDYETSRDCDTVKDSVSKWELGQRICNEEVLTNNSARARSLSCCNLHPPDVVVNLRRVKSETDITLCPADRWKQFLQKEGSRLSIDSCYAYGVTPGICAGLKTSEVEDYDSYVVCHKASSSADNAEESNTPPGPHKHHERSKSETEVINQDLKHTSEKQISMDGKNEKKKRTVKNILNQLKSVSSFSPIENPFSNLEHLLLPVPQKVPVVVHEEEPSSIIAYALATDDYEQKLQELKLNLNLSQKDSLTSSPLLKHKSASKVQLEGMSKTETFSTEDTFDFSMDSSEKSHSKPTHKQSNVHLEVQFADTSTKFYCRVYYAEQFRKLRSLIFAEGEERFIRSLCHCVQWAAGGGKSGSLFCKTLDDRFILKQMPRLEMQSFMDLAPAYFQYLNKAYLEQKPTLLAKIVGIFRVGFKNSATNAATKMDLLVMENLFYKRSIIQKYDLKGSIRNRLVNTSGDHEDIVLLDENLLKITCDNPFYVRPYSKTLLTNAISNDTQFLLDQSVMDYSLLVGLEEEKGQLIVGIIDYIRTFTWDKKVEMLIKSSGILGGHGKMPTVVSPELYRIRFCEAMDSYFLWVPDYWAGLGKAVDG